MKYAYPSLVILATTLVISACGGRGTATREELNDLKPFLSDAPHAEQLVGCVKANSPWSSCSVSTLPPLAMETPEPGITDIMQRVVVSHPWMGQRFQQLLTQLPDDMFYLFGAVTAVVIDADIRPSYYWKMTGAIYLDPASLWLTLDEKDSISRKEDYRAGNESEMRFRVYGRQSINGADAYRGYNLDSTEPRPLSDMVLPMANLLFHELAHANDHFPRHSYHTVVRSGRISGTIDNLHQQHSSTLLRGNYPLNATILFQVANIFYRGFTPSEAQTFWNAGDMGDAFADDGANDTYAYSSQYEDLAMLFEEAMMYIHFGVERELAFIEAPEQKYPDCGEAYMAWGQRNRIGDPWVKERLKYVLQQILPDRDYGQRIDDIPEPTQLVAGTDWCDMVNDRRAVNVQTDVKPATFTPSFQRQHLLDYH